MPVSEKRREYAREYARAHRADRTARQNARNLNVKHLKTSAPVTIITCQMCGKQFAETKAKINSMIKAGQSAPKYCSRECYYLSKVKPGGFSKLPYMDEVHELMGGEPDEISK